ncbi:MAG: CAP domain-containing protein [Isosphaeraceae bacterium]
MNIVAGFRSSDGIRRRALLLGWPACVLAGCVTVVPRPRSRASQSPEAIAKAYSGLIPAHNDIRSGRGRTPLVSDARLMRCAQDHADDMAQRRRMSHRGGDGSSPFQRMSRAGFQLSSAAENVAAGQLTLDELMGDWMRSPGHRRNILGAFTAIGTGYAIDGNGTPYWCVTFGTTRDAIEPAQGEIVGYPS